jgi:hypothetical protein
MATPARVTRRSALKRLGAGAGSVALWPYLSDAGLATFARIQAAGQAPAPVFFDAVQFAATDALAETIIPADDRSPGARAARVADYIDLLLSESRPEMQKAWAAGLASLDRLSRDKGGQPFVKLPPAQALAVLMELSRNEASPRNPLEQFFKDAKDATIRGYYTSEIGIQQELQYKGNTFVPEFLGCTHPEHGYKS